MSLFVQSFAQTTLDAAESSAAAGLGAGMVILYLLVAVVSIIALWKVFTKAGRPGWAAIVPFYNAWVLSEISGRPGWFGLVATLVAAIPVVGWIAALLMILLISMDLAVKFGKSKAFGVVALFIFSVVGFLILGFGQAKYDGSRPTDTPKFG